MGLSDFLTGKKTYIAALGFGLLAFHSLLIGDQAKAVEYALAAFGLFGIRSAIDRAK